MARPKEAHIFINKKMLEKWKKTKRNYAEPSLFVTILFIMQRFQLSHRSAIEVFKDTFNKEVTLPSASKIFKEIEQLKYKLKYISSFSYSYLVIDNIHTNDNLINIKANRVNRITNSPDIEEHLIQGRERTEHILFFGKNGVTSKAPIIIKKIKKDKLIKENDLDKNLTTWFKSNSALVKSIKSILNTTDGVVLFDSLIPLIAKRKWVSHKPKSTKYGDWAISTLRGYKFSPLHDTPDKSSYTNLAINQSNKTPLHQTTKIGSLNVSLLALTYKEKSPRHAGQSHAIRLLLFVHCNNSSMNFIKPLEKFLHIDEKITYSIEIIKNSELVTINILNDQSIINGKIEIPYKNQSGKTTIPKIKKDDWGFISDSTLKSFGEDVPNNFQTKTMHLALKATPFNTGSYKAFDEGKFEEQLTLWNYYLNLFADLNSEDKKLFDKSDFKIIIPIINKN